MGVESWTGIGSSSRGRFSSTKFTSSCSDDLLAQRWRSGHAVRSSLRAYYLS
jgi:hypothetical protein